MRAYIEVRVFCFTQQEALSDLVMASAVFSANVDGDFFRKLSLQARQPFFLRVLPANFQRMPIVRWKLQGSAPAVKGSS